MVPYFSWGSTAWGVSPNGKTWMVRAQTRHVGGLGYFLGRASILLLACLQGCQPEIFSIGDQAYPYVYLMEPSVPVFWNTKFFALRMAGSQAVRINARGVRFIPPDSSAIALVNSSTHSRDFHILPADDKGRNPWQVFRCKSSTDALCQIDTQGSGYTSRLFPNAGSPVYITHGELPESPLGGIPKFVTGNCPESSTGRVANFEKRWDVSICNILGMGSDFVYMPYTSELFVLQDPISFQMFAVISALTIFLTIVLAHNLEFALGSTATNSSTTISLVGIYALLFCSTFATGDQNILLPYVTLEDRLSFVCLFGYILYYTLRILANTLIGDQTMGSPVNPILATLVLVALRFFTTLDNPYTIILTFLVTARLLHKLTKYTTSGVCKETEHRIVHNSFTLYCRNFCRERIFFFVLWDEGSCDSPPVQRHLWRGVDIIADGVLVSIMVYVGVVPQHNNDPAIIALYLLQGLYAAATLNRAMMMFEKRSEGGE